MKEHNFPCIKNLNQFRKTGCPKKPFDFETGQGCYAWVIVGLNKLKNPQEPEHVQGCIEVVDSIINHRNYLKLDSIHSAIDLLRDGLCMNTKEGTVPRPNPAETATAIILDTMNIRNEVTMDNLKIENEVKKQIDLKYKD